MLRPDSVAVRNRKWKVFWRPSMWSMAPAQAKPWLFPPFKCCGAQAWPLMLHWIRCVGLVTAISYSLGMYFRLMLAFLPALMCQVLSRLTLNFPPMRGTPKTKDTQLYSSQWYARQGVIKNEVRTTYPGGIYTFNKGNKYFPEYVFHFPGCQQHRQWISTGSSSQSVKLKIIARQIQLHQLYRIPLKNQFNESPGPLFQSL